MTARKLLPMPVRERNLLTLLRMGGVEPDEFPGEVRLALLEDFETGFDFYTNRGADFAAGIDLTLRWMFPSTPCE